MPPKKIHEFYLVHFFQEEGVFDIVPKQWLQYDTQIEEFCCQFHNGENPEDAILALSLIKRGRSPLPEWKLYPVHIRGCAQTYSDAELRLEKLKENSYAFSTSDEACREEELQSLKKTVKLRRNTRNGKEIDNLLDTVAKNNSKPVDQDHAGKSFHSSIGDVRKNSRVTRKRTRGDSSSSRSSEDEDDTPIKNLARLNGTPCASKKEQKNDNAPRSVANYQTEQPDGQKNSRNKFSQWSQSLDSRDKYDNKVCKEPGSTPTSGRSDAVKGKNLFKSSSMRQLQDGAEQSDFVIRELKNLALSVTQLRAQVVRISNTQDEIKQLLLQLRNQQIRNPAVGEADHIPRNLSHYRCTNLQKFQELDTRIKDDKDFREIISQSIADKINMKESLSKVLGNILKPIITKEILMNFTAQKKTTTKSRFVELEIWTCIIEKVRAEARRCNVDLPKESDFVKALGKCINNCRSWGRKKQTDDNDDLEERNGAIDDAGGQDAIDDGTGRNKNTDDADDGNDETGESEKGE